MWLSQIQLTDFRNYVQLTATLFPGLTVLLGPNAAGKSAFLEAMVLLATGRSPRARSLCEVIRWDTPDTLGFASLARIAGEVQAPDGGHVALDFVVQAQRPSADGNAHGCYTRRRANRRALRYARGPSYLRTVLFCPEDLDLLTGSPDGRRAYLDGALQTEPAYAHALGRYRAVLAGRNELLRRNRAGAPVRNQEFVFWNRELSRHGAVLIAGRRRWISQVAPHLQAAHSQLGGGSEIRLEYSSLVPDAGVDGAAQVEAFQQAMRAVWPQEIERGVTLVGPHRDDFSVLLAGRNLATYGSRGQQRTAILALKWAEVALVQEEIGDAPVVLLDDVMSELDATRRSCLANWLLSCPCQVFVAATNLAPFPPLLLERAHIVRVEAGTWQEG